MSKATDLEICQDLKDRPLERGPASLLKEALLDSLREAHNVPGPCAVPSEHPKGLQPDAPRAPFQDHQSVEGLTLVWCPGLLNKIHHHLYLVPLEKHAPVLSTMSFSCVNAVHCGLMGEDLC